MKAKLPGLPGGAQTGDLTRDEIPGLIRQIALPASLGTVFSTLYNFTDTYWAGRLSSDSLAALTPNFTVFLIVLSIGVGFASGAGALISNSLGAGKKDEARIIYIQALMLAIVVQLVLSLVLGFTLEGLFGLMGTEPDILPRAMAYGRVIVYGGAALTMNQVVNSALGARGISKPFRNALIIGFVANLILDPVLMNGVIISGRQIIPALEERGIALATVIIQGLTGLVMLAVVNIHGGFEGLTRDDFKPRPALWKELMEQVFPAMMNFMIMALGTLVINMFIGRYGRTVVAAYGTALRIEQFALIPNTGLTFALAAMVGQNNGAGNTGRIRESLRVSLRYGLYIMLGLLTPVLLFGRQLMSLITADQEIIRIGYEYLMIQGITFFSYIILFQANSVLQGLKKPAMIMWMGLYRQVLAPALIFSLLSVVLGLAERGVWWGLVLVNWSAALMTLVWTHRMMRKNEAPAGTPSPEKA